MGAISKQLFEQVYTDVPCSVLLHPWNESCLKAISPIFMASMVGSARFYSLVYLAQILIRGKKMLKKDEWIKMGQYYIRSTALGCLVTATAPPISCFIRKICGNKFGYYTYLFIPFTVNGLFIYLEHPSRRSLVLNLFCNLLVEYYLKILQRAGYVSISKSQQTLVFMLGSALLFYLMRLEGDKKERTPLLWLYTAEKVRGENDDSNKVCPHEGSCSKYITKGSMVYFGVGAVISLARLILPKLRTPIKAVTSIRGKHFKLAMFFGSYIGIYRAIVCLLCRKRGFDSALYALPAGYAAGLSFLFSPSLGLSIASMTAAFKLYTTILYERKILPSNIPLPELLYCFCQGTLMNARVLDPEACPNYIINLMKIVSQGRAEWITENFSEVARKALL